MLATATFQIQTLASFYTTAIYSGSGQILRKQAVLRLRVEQSDIRKLEGLKAAFM